MSVLPNEAEPATAETESRESWVRVGDLCFLFRVVDSQISSCLICFTLFTRLWWTGLTGLASAHVLLHQAQFGFGS